MVWASCVVRFSAEEMGELTGVRANPAAREPV
jgi:hypothetical protein